LGAPDDPFQAEKKMRYWPEVNLSVPGVNGIRRRLASFEKAVPSDLQLVIGTSFDAF